MRKFYYYSTYCEDSFVVLNQMQQPNPLKAPSFIQSLQFILNPVGFLEKVHQQYPDIFTAKIFGFTGIPVVVVQHPQAIQEILTNDRKKFVVPGHVNKILQPLLGKHSLLMVSGEQHKRQRQLVMPSFHKERMQSYGQLIVNLTEKVMSQLSLNQVFSACSVMQEISLQVILQAVFGLYEGQRYEKLKHLLPLMLGLFRSPLYNSFLFFPFLQKDFGAWSPWGRFVRIRQQIDELLYAEIAERRVQPNSDRIDILSLLMEATDEEGQPMTDKELRDELMTMLVGGFDSTAIAMAWELYWTHHLPEVGEKLRQELDNLGNSKNPMDIFRLPYLSAVCNETLRIYPVGVMANVRFVQEPVELLGYHLEPGTAVIPCIYLTHHRKDLYQKPKQFLPERFVQRQYTPYEFLPFGGGVRRCIGDALAMFEMKLVLATILSHYKLALADHQPVTLQRQIMFVGPGNGIKMVMTGRRTPFKIPQSTSKTT
uniref:Monooxygenase n=1 Tax=Westiella intricata UH HT-29-1 TaxID=1524912 RepID=A0A075X7H1_9CYAN|nr:monooxygenase [Westiella intricata UH HT-29-1]